MRQHGFATNPRRSDTPVRLANFFSKAVACQRIRRMTTCAPSASTDILPPGLVCIQLAVIRLRQHDSKSDTAIVCGRIDSIPPPNATVKVPVVVTTAAESPLRSRAKVWPSITGNCFKIVSAYVLAPLPHVSRHVE